jgi:MbtH protein
MSESDGELFDVVRNEEDQYSIWRADREIPSGWDVVGVRGPREQCLQYIAENWTDMRPRSLREWLAARADGSPS